MRLRSALRAAVACMAWLPGVVAAQAPELSVAFVNATVIDVESGRALPGQMVVTRGDRIVSVGPSRAAAVPRGATRVDLRGAFVIPGLWDMHVHIATDTTVAPEARTEYYGSLFLANGVTGVRDAGGNLAVLRSLDSMGRSPRTPMPRMIYAGGKLGGAAIQTIEDVRMSIRTLRSAGASYVKLAPSYPIDLIRPTLAECTAAGLRCVAHVPAADTSVWLSAPGRGSYEHLFNLAEHVSSLPADRLFALREEYEHPTFSKRLLYKLRLRTRPREPDRQLVAVRDTTRDRGFFGALAAAGTWMTPTLVLHHQMTRVVDALAAALDPALVLSPELTKVDSRTPGQRQDAKATWALWSGIVGAMSRAGVPLLAGTDFSGMHVPGASLHAELVFLQAAGMTAPEVLRTATVNAGRYLGGDSLGVVRAGAVADIVVLRANPLEDIRNVTAVEMVMTRGRLLRRNVLDSLAGRAAVAAGRLRAAR